MSKIETLYTFDYSGKLITTEHISRAQIMIRIIKYYLILSCPQDKKLYLHGNTEGHCKWWSRMSTSCQLFTKSLIICKLLGCFLLTISAPPRTNHTVSPVRAEFSFCWVEMLNTTQRQLSSSAGLRTQFENKIDDRKYSQSQ